MDPLRDLNTARGDPEAFEWSDTYVRNEKFEEVTKEILNPDDWEVVLNGKWKHDREHITLKEARCLCLAVRRLTRTSRNRGKKHLVLVESRGQFGSEAFGIWEKADLATMPCCG